MNSKPLRQGLLQCYHGSVWGLMLHCLSVRALETFQSVFGNITTGGCKFDG